MHLRAERAFGLDAVRTDRIAAPQAATAPAAPVIERAQPARPSAPVAESVAVTSGRPATRKPTVSTPPPANLVDPQARLMPTPDQSPFTAPILSTDEKIATLASMNEMQVRGCTKCRLCETRTQTVFGEGDVDAEIFFIGEGPGENEDLTGRPFVGKAGQLLDKMIVAMGLRREQVYIANIVKCRPPGNRAPAPDETAACTPYLLKQLETVRPKVIVTLGHPAARYMLETKQTMGRLRGNWHSWRGIQLMPTFHPSYVLRSYTEEVRAAVWSDLQQVLAALGKAAPKKGKGTDEK
ncbi:MAG TPA: uracil-DNA glycosylase [Tepidisphaeraceae bacterium]|nr:uracil-DNA glycosylase [Tepidisphaeraceae bacterium]